MTCPYLPIVTSPVRYDATVFVHSASNYRTQTEHDHSAHYNYIKRTRHSATYRISQICDTSEFITCYAAAANDSIYIVSFSSYNRAVQASRKEHGKLAKGMWEQAAATTIHALIFRNVYTDINCVSECSVPSNNIHSHHSYMQTVSYTLNSYISQNHICNFQYET